MARGGIKAEKRIKVDADPIYGSYILAKFINRTMKDGKKTTAEKSVYGALQLLESEGHDPIKTFEDAIDNVGPKVEVKARRIGGAAYQVPTEVRGTRRVSLAIRWVLEAARKRPNTEYRSFSAKLAAEFLDASQNQGEAMRKKEVAHRMAEANKAFAHFRF